jgi:hypothetical protein
LGSAPSLKINVSQLRIQKRLFRRNNSGVGKWDFDLEPRGFTLKVGGEDFAVFRVFSMQACTNKTNKENRNEFR